MENTTLTQDQQKAREQAMLPAPSLRKSRAEIEALRNKAEYLDLASRGQTFSRYLSVNPGAVVTNRDYIKKFAQSMLSTANEIRNHPNLAEIAFFPSMVMDGVYDHLTMLAGQTDENLRILAYEQARKQEQKNQASQR